VIGFDEQNDSPYPAHRCAQDRLRPIALGDSTALKVGQKVLAIGNPLGLQNTLTTVSSAHLERIQTENGELVEQCDSDGCRD